MSRFTLVKDVEDLFSKEIEATAADIALGVLLEKGVITEAPEHRRSQHLGARKQAGDPCRERDAGGLLFHRRTSAGGMLLSVRTGPTESNKAIASGAIAKGWKWHAYGDGFTRGEGKASIDKFVVKQERDAFDFVGLPYLQPEKR